ncbi:hypothetical protein A0H81_01303 [Grifola frondosa]|uniref:DUF6533 domain-containing protein n=1 Tax=Grifola frondosa TaxID=5627 RepID=A0A1C7MSN1_GRIFR|nr:hypothetical protein A0H81_01303 [Grifola frondosa]
MLTVLSNRATANAFSRGAAGGSCLLRTMATSFSVQSALDAGKRSRIGALALLAYDILLTLDLEVKHIWPQSKRRPAFWFYVYNRLFALFYLIFDSIPLSPNASDIKDQICVIYLACDHVVALLTTTLVQVILLLRIYALYDRSRRVLIFLAVSLCIEAIATAVVIAATMVHIEHFPVESTSTGCSYTGTPIYSAFLWVPALLFEPVLFAFAAWKAWQLHNVSGGTSLIARIVRDSLFYFILVFAELLVSAIIWSHFPEYINIMMPWSSAIPSFLGSRMLLNMHEAASYQGGGSTLKTSDPSEDPTIFAVGNEEWETSIADV